MKKIGIILCSLFLIHAQGQDMVEQFVSNFEKNGAMDASLAKKAMQELQNNTKLVSPELMASFYNAMTKGNMNDSSKAIEFFGKLNAVEGKEYFVAKNKDTKNQEYFWDKAAAEKVTAAGNYSKLKSKTAASKYVPMLKPSFEKLPQKALEVANKAYGDKDYPLAAKKFKETYVLTKALDNENGVFAFYSALAYHQAKDYDNAIDGYKSLIASGYTGEKTNYTAALKGTENRISFKNEKEFETAKKNPLYSDFNVKKDPSVEHEIYGNLLSLMSVQEKYDEMTPYVNEAQEKFPNNNSINQTIANYYFKSGQTDKFQARLEENLKKNPNDAGTYFNLGALILEKEDYSAAEAQQAKDYLKKAIELDPKMSAAYGNLALLILKPEASYVEKINANLNRKDKKQKKIFDEYSAKRKTLYVEALPYLEKKFEFEPENYMAVKSLRVAYGVLGNFDKEDEMLVIEKKLRAERRAKR